MLKERQTLEGAGFLIKEGITEKQIDQLIVYSTQDSEVLNFTSDSKRFTNKDAFKKWQRKERTVFVLEDRQGSLLGIAWFGKEPLPRRRKYTLPVNWEEYNTTFAIRLYPPARDRGLAFEFMTKVATLYYYCSGWTNVKMWLEVHNDNVPAIKLYEKFGFTRLTKPDRNGRILMG